MKCPNNLPDGFITLFEGMDRLGREIFGDQWTGEEIEAKSEDQWKAELQKIILSRRERKGKTNDANRRSDQKEVQYIFTETASNIKNNSELLGRREFVADRYLTNFLAGTLKAAAWTPSGRIVWLTEDDWDILDSGENFDTGKISVRDHDGFPTDAWILLPVTSVAEPISENDEEAPEIEVPESIIEKINEIFKTPHTRQRNLGWYKTVLNTTISKEISTKEKLVHSIAQSVDGNAGTVARVLNEIDSKWHEKVRTK